MPFLLLFLWNSALAQIASTGAGGNWSETGTWIGGRVPEAGDDVIINGPVNLNQDRTCRNITVNAGAALRNSGHTSLTANSLINRGTVENSGGGWVLRLRIASSVVNDGTSFAPQQLVFTGGGDAQMSGSSLFNMREFDKEINGRIVASSALRFGDNCAARLQNDVLVMGSNKLTIVSNDSYYFNGSSYSGGEPDATIQSTGEIDVTGPFRMNLQGSPTLTGTGVMRMVVVVPCENLTVAPGKTVHNYGHSSITVSGNLINRGTIENSGGGWTLSVHVGNSFVNDGVFAPQQLLFTGAGNAQISGSGVFNMREFDKQVDGRIVAGSVLRFGPNCAARLQNDVLAMGSFKLTVESTGDYFFNGSSYSGGDPDATIESSGEIDVTGLFRMRMTGNPTLTGTGTMALQVSIPADNLTVAAGKTIVNSGHASLSVAGTLVNRGTMRNSGGGWTLRVHVGQSFVNEGTFEVQELNYSTSEPSQLSGSGLLNMFEFNKTGRGRIIAGNPLRFGTNCAARLEGDTLDMGSHKLTIRSGDRWFNGSSYSGGDPDASIRSTGEIDHKGAIRMNLLGSPSLTGTDTTYIVVVVPCDNLTIAQGKTVLNSGHSTLRVTGTLVNNGIVKNGGGGWNLRAHVGNSFTNNGTFEPQELYYYGAAQHMLSASSLLNMFEFNVEESGRVRAASPLSFGTNCAARLQGDTLDMGSHKLTIRSSGDRWFNGSSYSGGDPDASILSYGEIDHEGYFRMNLLGNPSLTGAGVTEVVVTVPCDNLTIAAGKVVQNSGHSTLRVAGNFVNNGTLRSSGGGWMLTVNPWGNTAHNGRMDNVYVTVSTAMRSLRWSGRGSVQASSFTVAGDGRLSLTDSLRFVGNISTESNATLEISSGGLLHIMGELRGSGRVVNNGRLRTKVALADNRRIDLPAAFGAQIFPTSVGGADSLEITQYGSQVYPGTGQGTLRQWWSFRSTPPLRNYYVNLSYPQSAASGLEEHRLMAFAGTTAGGLKLVSNPVNTTRDTAANTFALGNSQNLIDEPLNDLALSTGRIGVMPDLGIALSGPSNIRVGPKNRYTLTYWNNSDYETPPLIIGFKTQGGIYMQSVLTTNELTGDVVELNRDSLRLFDEEEDYVLIKASPMAPGEIRHFDLTMTADPTAKVTALPLAAYWVLAGIISYTSVKVGEYMLAAQMENCIEWAKWYDEQNPEVKRKFWDIFSESVNKKAEGWQGDLKESAAVATLEQLTRVSIPAADFTISTYKCMGKMFGMLINDCSQRQPTGGHKNADHDKEIADFLAQHQTSPMTCKEMPLRKVTSWDPNEKYGPAGHDGARNHIREAEPLTYRVAFENVDTAQAAAWRVIVVDTLDPTKVDVESVEFTRMSHDMGVATRTGNVLRWEFVDIDLPPNQNPPEGEGWVEFTVRQRPSLAQGTEFRNRASITFDLNRPMLTNTTVNTLDKVAPTTAPVGAHRIEGDNERVLVRWNATDDGSGVGATYVYLEIDSLPVRLVGVSDSASTVIAFNPYETKPFKLFVVSEDRVGNMEEQTGLALTEILEPIGRQSTAADRLRASLRVSPNPADERLNVEFRSDAGGAYAVELHDLTGRLAFRQTGETTVGTERVSLDLREIPRGVYVLRVSGGGASAVSRVILN